MVCMCSVVNFFNVVLHVIVGGVLLWLITRRKELRSDKFFFLLLLGKVAHHTSEPIKGESDGHHPCLHHAVLQVGDHSPHGIDGSP